MRIFSVCNLWIDYFHLGEGGIWLYASLSKTILLIARRNKRGKHEVMADLETQYFNDIESGMRLTQCIRYGVVARGIGDVY